MQFVSEDMLNKVINSAYINFLNFEQNVIYSLDNEVPNDVDAEASYLGRWIFIELFKKNGRFYKIDYSGTTISCNDEKWSFDVMNNPKPHPKNAYRLGSIAKKNNIDISSWTEIYRTIGNFTPIPNVKRGRHLQHKHNDLAERWDFLLGYCEKNWSEFNLEDISFVEYMKLSVQQMYFQDVYNDYCEKIKGYNLNEVSDEKILEWLIEWNDMISDKSEIISFGEKITDLPIKDIAEKICSLIMLRSRIIIALLKSDIYMFAKI